MRTEPIGNFALAERAYCTIRERILCGTYAFGGDIPRRELAAELGMSLVPLNGALARLESEYLVENIPRVGTRVRVPTLLDIRGFWAVREALETQAARFYAHNATPTAREQLRRMGAELDALHESVSVAAQPDQKALYEWRHAHMQYHLYIAECTRFPFLCQAIEKNQFLVFNWFYDRQLSAARALPPHWHESLAIRLAEASEAEGDAAMRDHLRYRLEDLFRRLEEHLILDR